MAEKLTYLCNTVPNLPKLQKNLPLILPYVDAAVICIGERHPETEAFCKSFDKVKLVHFPWNDSFKDAYQVCLDHAPKEGWHLRLDDDEAPTPSFLSQLRSIVGNRLIQAGYGVISVRAHQILDDNVSGSTYEREIVYRYNPNLRYEVDLHQSLVGIEGAKLEIAEWGFSHIKSTREILAGACRDYFIAGVWADKADTFPFWYKLTGQDPRLDPNRTLEPSEQGIAFPLRTGFKNDAWIKMKLILAQHHPEVDLFRDLNNLIKSGQICQEFKDWAVKFNEENDTRPHLFEQHAFDKYLKLLEKDL